MFGVIWRGWLFWKHISESRLQTYCKYVPSHTAMGHGFYCAVQGCHRAWFLLRGSIVKAIEYTGPLPQMLTPLSQHATECTIPTSNVNT